MTTSSTSHLQDLLARLNAGDAGARPALIAHARQRLLRLTRRMLQDFRRLRRWEESDDVLQNASIRLDRALQAAPPPQTVAAFFALATRQIRRELLDLARHYYGAHGQGTHHASGLGAGRPPLDAAEAGGSQDPARLASWGDFHERAAALPDDEREVFDLLWYQGLTQAEAAAVLGVAVITVKRRWLSARLLLQEGLPDQLPD